jgi:hypothetical protein
MAAFAPTAVDLPTGMESARDLLQSLRQAGIIRGSCPAPAADPGAENLRPVCVISRAATRGEPRE